MANKRNLNFEIDNSLDLNKMLTGLLMDIRRGDVEHKAAQNITLVVDKINKNNVNALEYKKLTKHNKKLSFFEGETEEEGK